MSVRERYQENLDQLRQQTETLLRCDRLLSWARGVAFFVTAGLFFVAYVEIPLLYVPAVLVLAVFLGLVGYHEHLEHRLETLGQQRRIYREFLARLDRRWSELPRPEVRIAKQHRAVAHDLDLAGKGSLLQLLGPTSTPLGLQQLADWLLDFGTVEQVRRRQQSVRQLAPAAEFREQLLLVGRQLMLEQSNPYSFLEWAESDSSGRLPLLLHRAAIVLPVLLAGAVAVTVAGVLPPLAAATSVLVLLAANAGLSVVFCGTIHATFGRIASRRGNLTRYRQLLEQIARYPQAQGQLAEMQQQISGEQQGALQELKRLERVIALSDLRRQALTFIPYVILQLVLLWDMHLWARLHRWQVENGHLARRWFEALGQFDALAAMAGLAHDYPQWPFADVEPSADRVQATALGHPLLPDDQRVCNDVELGPPGTFLLVTGSNMSGKSTLLRAMGVNVQLALAGAPVCAKRLQLPPLQLATSMRIADSLTDGISFFMAELKRLKEIVDLADEHAGRSDRRICFLLDEILQGTNSGERQVAVIRVVLHLLRRGAIGAVSTHDLELADVEALRGVCRAVHFRETLHTDSDQPMTFDYQMRPGPATTTNAIKLLELVGLELEQHG